MFKKLISNAVLILVLAFTLCLKQNVLAATLSNPNNKIMIFISDLHLGVGRDPSDPEPDPSKKRWHPTEDFRWHKEFSGFLDRVDSDGNSNVDLILVGDTFELWQSLDITCYPDDRACQQFETPRFYCNQAGVGCSQDEAKVLINRIIAQHQDFFSAISKFVAKGNNRVTFIPGNHDAALLFPEVWATVQAAFESEARNKIKITTEGYWQSEDGKVYAEHGHQIGEDPNKFDNWPSNPFVTLNGIQYLQQPWGEGFVQKFYSRYENKFPVIDNLSSEFEGVKYAMGSEGVEGTLNAVAKFLKFALFQTSLSQTSQILGGSEENNRGPKWKVKEIQETLKTPKERLRFLVASLEKQSPFRLMLEEQIKNTDTFPEIAEFTDQDVIDICDKRWILNKQEEGSFDECVSDLSLGQIQQSLIDKVNPAYRNNRFQDYLKKKSPDKKLDIFIYAHTHIIESETEKDKDEGYYPFKHGSAWDPVVFNDGAWQRTATPEQLKAIIGSNGDRLPPSEAIKQTPEKLPACYPYVVITYGIKPPYKPKARLRYWIQYPTVSGYADSKC
ncbi:MAG: metallophosphoesterase [Methylococcaceae bacterium]